MKKSILIIMLLVRISALGQECGCVTPTQYKAINPVGKTDAIIDNPYENFKIINPKYSDYKGKTPDGVCVRLTFGYGNVSVKKGQKKPKAYIDGIVMEETRLRGILCLNGNKYNVIGRYMGDGYWTGAVYSLVDKPALYEIRLSENNKNDIDVDIQDGGENTINNLKLVGFKKKESNIPYSRIQEIKNEKSNVDKEKYVDPIVVEEKNNGSSEIKEDNNIYNSASIEIKPDFPGGVEKLYKFIASNYQTPKKENLKGKIYVTFFVEKDGALSHIKVTKDIGYGTGEEAIRVLKICPKWNPGIQNGEKVRMPYSLPINIQSSE